MKLTESQLRKLVKEEIDALVDEGLMDFIKGSGGKVGGDIAKKLGGGVEKVKKYGASVKRSGQMASLGADIKKLMLVNKRMLKRIKALMKDAPDLHKDALGDVEDIETAISSMDSMQARILGAPDASGGTFKPTFTEQNKRKRK